MACGSRVGGTKRDDIEPCKSIGESIGESQKETARDDFVVSL